METKKEDLWALRGGIQETGTGQGVTAAGPQNPTVTSLKLQPKHPKCSLRGFRVAGSFSRSRP